MNNLRCYKSKTGDIYFVNGFATCTKSNKMQVIFTDIYTGKLFIEEKEKFSKRMTLIAKKK